MKIRHISYWILFAAVFLLLAGPERRAVPEGSRPVVAEHGAPVPRLLGGIGLVLRAREELLYGTLVAQTEFESLDLAPDLSGVAFSQGLTDEEALPPGSKPDLTGLGFQPPVPKQLPAGWRLQEVAKLVDPTDDRAWAKLVYTDGVDLLFFLAAAPEPPQRALVGGSAAQPARVRALSVGAWTVLQGDLAGHELVVMGKADEEVLADLIRSALP